MQGSNIRVMAAITTELPTYRLDAAQYARIVESGALDDKRVELIDGIIVQMSPQSPEHSLLIRRLNRHFKTATRDVLVQLPLEVARDSVPEPDAAIVDEPEDPHHHPKSALLVVEVAQSSQAIDRGRKAELYAAAGIPTYWVIDIPARAVEVRTDPGPASYRTLRTLEPGEVLPSPCDGVADLPVDELLRGI